jgi:hypothetical protein
MEETNPFVPDGETVSLWQVGILTILFIFIRIYLFFLLLRNAIQKYQNTHSKSWPLGLVFTTIETLFILSIGLVYILQAQHQIPSLDRYWNVYLFPFLTICQVIGWWLYVNKLSKIKTIGITHSSCRYIAKTGLTVIIFTLASVCTFLPFFIALNPSVIRITLLLCYAILHLLCLTRLSMEYERSLMVMKETISVEDPHSSELNVKRTMAKFFQLRQLAWMTYGGCSWFVYLSQIVLGWNLYMIWIQFFLHSIVYVMIVLSIRYKTSNP